MASALVIQLLIHLLVEKKIKASLDRNKFGCRIFIDLQKAFDTGNHDIPLKKLEHYGIGDTALNWFKSYLANRKQFVSINGHSSSLANISYIVFPKEQSWGHQIHRIVCLFSSLLMIPTFTWML